MSNEFLERQTQLSDQMFATLKQLEADRRAEIEHWARTTQDLIEKVDALHDEIRRLKGLT